MKMADKLAGCLASRWGEERGHADAGEVPFRGKRGGLRGRYRHRADGAHAGVVVGPQGFFMRAS